MPIGSGPRPAPARAPNAPPDASTPASRSRVHAASCDDLAGRSAEQHRDPASVLAHGPAELLHPPGREVELETGHADRPGAAAGVVVDRGADAEDSVGVLLVVDRVAAAADLVE